MKNIVKIVFLQLLVIIFLLTFYGCSNNSNPSEKSSSSRASEPSDTEIKNTIKREYTTKIEDANTKCSVEILERGKRIEEGSFPLARSGSLPIRVRIKCQSKREALVPYEIVSPNCITQKPILYLKKTQDDMGNYIWRIASLANDEPKPETEECKK
jgi:hypothetical protein